MPVVLKGWEIAACPKTYISILLRRPSFRMTNFARLCSTTRKQDFNQNVGSIE